jgi:hypothetical protein
MIDAGLLIVGSRWSSQLRPILAGIFAKERMPFYGVGFVPTSMGLMSIRLLLIGRSKVCLRHSGSNLLRGTFRGRRQIELVSFNGESLG